MKDEEANYGKVAVSLLFFSPPKGVRKTRHQAAVGDQFTPSLRRLARKKKKAQVARS
jgi:hypothetical protein